MLYRLAALSTLAAVAAIAWQLGYEHGVAQR